MAAKGKKPGRKSNNKLKPKTEQEDKKDSFYVIGIGASAGGLDALELFFKNMTPGNAMAYVVISHLSPSHASILPELIGKHTAMKVVQIEDKMTIVQDHVYVTPPNKDVAVTSGVFYLFDPVEARGLRLPIDYFFRSLAHDQKEKAVAIILSGTGSDGTLGIKDIKAELGMIMAQEPQSARYDSMVRNAINTNLVDYILPPEKMPDQLIKYVQHLLPSPLKKAAPVREDVSESLQNILILIRSRTGHDFSFYKKNTIRRRIERRMSVHQIDTAGNYLKYLQKYPHEIDILFDELLIGVTSFFRDKDAFQFLKEKVISPLIKEKPDYYIFRVWVAGCSTGEEAYSIAIIIQECMEEHKKNFKVNIFGTDLDSRAIETARAGIYPFSIAADVSQERLDRFFKRDDKSYQIKKEIRDMVIFAPQNVIKDPPFINLNPERVE